MKDKVTITVQIDKEIFDTLQRAARVIKKTPHELYQEALEEQASVFKSTLKMLDKIAIFRGEPNEN